jgi:hypothetical protein
MLFPDPRVSSKHIRGYREPQFPFPPMSTAVFCGHRTPNDPIRTRRPSWLPTQEQGLAVQPLRANDGCPPGTEVPNDLSLTATMKPCYVENYVTCCPTKHAVRFPPKRPLHLFYLNTEAFKLFFLNRVLPPSRHQLAEARCKNSLQRTTRTSSSSSHQMVL